LPSTPTAGYYLQTDGSGVLSWAAVSGGGGGLPNLDGGPSDANYGGVTNNANLSTLLVYDGGTP
jgi:hypothetical protein